MYLKRYEEYMIKRRKKKITLTELSKHVQVSISALSQYESGKMSLSKDKLEAYIYYINNKK